MAEADVLMSRKGRKAKKEVCSPVPNNGQRQVVAVACGGVVLAEAGAVQVHKTQVAAGRVLQGREVNTSLRAPVVQLREVYMKRKARTEEADADTERGDRWGAVYETGEVLYMEPTGCCIWNRLGAVYWIDGVLYR